MNIVEILEQLDGDIGLLYKTDGWLHSERAKISAEASDILNRLKVIDNAINIKKVFNGVDIGALRNVYNESTQGQESLMLELIKSYIKNSKLNEVADAEG